MADANRAWREGKAAEAATQSPSVEEDEDAALAAEIAELDRLEAAENDRRERDMLARLIQEELARDKTVGTSVQDTGIGDDEDAALAAEIAELDRLEAAEEEMRERELLARLVMEEIAREQEEEDRGG
eukprot:7181815-Prymnesium_polylepis.1